MDGRSTSWETRGSRWILLRPRYRHGDIRNATTTSRAILATIFACRPIIGRAVCRQDCCRTASNTESNVHRPGRASRRWRRISFLYIASHSHCFASPARTSLLPSIRCTVIIRSNKRQRRVSRSEFGSRTRLDLAKFAPVVRFMHRPLVRNVPTRRHRRTMRMRRTGRRPRQRVEPRLNRTE